MMLRVSTILLLCLVTSSAGGEPVDQDSLRLALETAEGEVRVDILNDLARSVDGTPETRAYAQEALDLAESLGYVSGQAFAHYYLGRSLYMAGSNLDAAHQFEASAPLFEKTGDLVFLTGSYILLAGCYTELGIYSTALEFSNRAVDVARKHGDPQYISSALRNLGAIYRFYGDLDAALGYVLEALEIAEALPPTVTLVRAYYEVGTIYGLKQDHERALDYYERALNLAEQLGSTYDTANLTYEIGRQYRILEKPGQALPMLERARDLCEEIGFTEGLANAYSELSLVYLQLGDVEKAKRLGLESYEKGKNLGHTVVDAILRDLHVVLEASGDYETALEFRKLHMAVRDSLAAETNARELGRIEAEYQIREDRERDARARERSKIIAFSSVGVVLLLLVTGSLYVWILTRKNRVITRQSEKITALDKIRSTFFANISHEFRTPLTLIKGPLNNIRSKTVDDGSRADLNIIERNANKLLVLVNQLLDLSKLESGKMDLARRPGDLVGCLRNVAASFEPLSQQGIAFDVALPEDPVITDFNADHCEKILANLLTNAFKFTPEGGRVSFTGVLIGESGLPFAHDEGPALATAIRVTVEDTGAGIPADQLENIYDRFYQVESGSSRGHGGTGIGLALVKELVELHGGRISIESEPGRGTKATVTLPLERVYSIGVTVGQDEKSLDLSYETTASPPPGAESDDPTRKLVLVVEDNADLRGYLRGRLSSEYTILEAENGNVGLELALDRIPDVIVSDIMMPGVDGNEMTRRLKSDARTSHVPIILLTAKATHGERIEGLESGADDYIVKPFDDNELILRLRNLLATRSRFQKKLKEGNFLQLQDVNITSIDEEFLRKAVQVVEDNIDNPDFSVETLASETGMSRAQFHRKIRALADHSTTEFIRSIRLDRAARLLERRAGTVTEIAYMVGFGSQAYFSKCFRERFGTSPSDYSKPSEERNSRPAPPA